LGTQVTARSSASDAKLELREIWVPKQELGNQKIELSLSLRERFGVREATHEQDRAGATDPHPAFGHPLPWGEGNQELGNQRLEPSLSLRARVSGSWI
jgi:hypothetical protein